LFYGLWNWKLLLLLFAISLVNYHAGRILSNYDRKNKRRLILIAGLILNLGSLAYFKYCNFFIEGFAAVSRLIGLNPQFSTLKILIPVGISFYVFLGISYIVDVYRRHIVAEHNLGNVLLTFSFFPIVMSGPIQRPAGLLPQIRTPRIFNAQLASEGTMQFIWGLFMKMVVANNCAVYVNNVFNSQVPVTGLSVLAGAIFFTIQIYADFSGYSDMAIGIGKILGFKIMRNFAYPYFARNIAEYWKRWNISLTTWFRDYVFLPFAWYISKHLKKDSYFFIKTDLIIYIAGILITWALTGLWHGSNYTFIIWGLLHGTYLIIHHILRKPKKKIRNRLNSESFNRLLQYLTYIAMMVVVIIGWIFFRAGSATKALFYLNKLIHISISSGLNFNPDVILVLLFMLVFIIEYIQRRKEFPLQLSGTLHWYIRYPVYQLVIIAIVFFGGGQTEFLYFKF
jgi:D-alanyl-lipoteichoic acid acyltransferase DltB (MBOAT superfamily)